MRIWLPLSLSGLLMMALASACTSSAPPEAQAPAKTSSSGDANPEAASSTSPEGKRLLAFVDEAFMVRVDRSPMLQAYLGIKKDQDKWDDYSEKRQLENLELTRTYLARLRNEFDFDALDPQSQVTYRLFEYQAGRMIDGFKWRRHNYPVNQMFGAQAQLPAFLINFHRIDESADARAYIKRLEGIPAFFATIEEELVAREKMGVLPPRFVFPMVIDDSRNVLQGRPFQADADTDSTLLADFRRKLDALDGLDKIERYSLIKRAERALLDSVAPAYNSLIATLERQAALASTDDGAWKLPDGDAYYDFMLADYTTTTMNADQIHEIGLREVARIKDEMRAIMKKVGFQGDLPAFFEHMRTSKEFYYSEDEAGRKAYLERAEKIIRDMEARLDELFITKPAAALVVKPVEAFREKSAGKAFYNPPAPDGSRPGVYYANLYKMSDMPTYQMEALAYHEAIPGHHMQNAIAQERLDLPKFRRFNHFAAYGEGWGLYAEYIPKEMGLYSDPYSDFGRLSMELWRACRLVVDTGIHRKRWTREQAIDYLNENTPNPEGDVVKAIERYIVSPGQATAYKVGMLEILRLRERAQQRLGQKFELRAFHDVVLTSGPVPLTILGELVDRWIASQEADVVADGAR